VLPADEPYIWGARLAMVAIVAILALLVHRAWKRHGYDSRRGFVEGTGAALPPGGAR
jgi:hypothetical protein